MEAPFEYTGGVVEVPEIDDDYHTVVIKSTVPVTRDSHGQVRTEFMFNHQNLDLGHNYLNGIVFAKQYVLQ